VNDTIAKFCSRESSIELINGCSSFFGSYFSGDSRFFLVGE